MVKTDHFVYLSVHNAENDLQLCVYNLSMTYRIIVPPAYIVYAEVILKVVKIVLSCHLLNGMKLL